MEWFIVAVAVVALGVAAVVAAGGGGSMAKDPVRDTYAMALSDEPFDAETVRRLRFGVALRGYSMDQVDVVLDRLARDLHERDERIAQLLAQLDGPAAVEESTAADIDEDPPELVGEPVGAEQPR